jgi:transposase-like protein
MTARKPAGRPCHVDDDLAHVARTPDEEVPPCSRRHKAAPSSASSSDLLKAGLLPRTRVRLLKDPELGSTLRPGERITIAARSTPKRARPAPVKRTPSGNYLKADRIRAVELVASAGIAEAHRLTEVPKATLSRWAKAAGVDVGEQARARTTAATAAVEAKVAEVKLTTVARLERVLEQQLRVEEELGNLELAGIAAARTGDLVLEHSIAGTRLVLEPTGPDAELVARARIALELSPKRDAVGARTRAVHDLNLLKGEATERGTILVRFGIPRPAGDVDAGVVDEADLALEAGA